MGFKWAQSIRRLLLLGINVVCWNHQTHFTSLDWNFLFIPDTERRSCFKLDKIQDGGYFFGASFTSSEMKSHFHPLEHVLIQFPSAISYEGNWKNRPGCTENDIIRGEFFLSPLLSRACDIPNRNALFALSATSGDYLFRFQRRWIMLDVNCQPFNNKITSPTWHSRFKSTNLWFESFDIPALMASKVADLQSCLWAHQARLLNFPPSPLWGDGISRGAELGNKCRRLGSLYVRSISTCTLLPLSDRTAGAEAPGVHTSTFKGVVM